MNTTTSARRRHVNRSQGRLLKVASRRGQGLVGNSGHDRNRRGHLHAREAWHERFRARLWSRLPYLFFLCSRIGWTLGNVSVARPRSQGMYETTFWFRRHDEYHNSEPSNGHLFNTKIRCASKACLLYFFLLRLD